MSEKLKRATFAGGCFWCMVEPFENIQGVKEVIVGYTGGEKENPTYQEVCAGVTGHYEAVQIVYDENVVEYQQILDVFWRQIDPTDDEGQFVDRGSHYRTAIFYHNDRQREVAEQSKEQLNMSGRFDRPVATWPRARTSARAYSFRAGWLPTMGCGRRLKERSGSRLPCPSTTT